MVNNADNAQLYEEVLVLAEELHLVIREGIVNSELAVLLREGKPET